MILGLRLCNLFKQRQRLGYYLVHVVISISGEAACKVGICHCPREAVILPIDLHVLRTRDRIIWITLCFWILVDDGRLVMFLTCEIFKLRNSRIGVFVGIVDGTS